MTETEELYKRLIYAQSQIACATILAEGMRAENQQREHRGMAMAYGEKEFAELLNTYGLHHNAILTAIHGH
jgi:hypothetical protein